MVMGKDARNKKCGLSNRYIRPGSGLIALVRSFFIDIKEVPSNLAPSLSGRVSAPMGGVGQGAKVRR